jgi:hypothetical protein
VSHELPLQTTAVWLRKGNVTKSRHHWERRERSPSVTRLDGGVEDRRNNAQTACGESIALGILARGRWRSSCSRSLSPRSSLRRILRGDQSNTCYLSVLPESALLGQPLQPCCLRRQYVISSHLLLFPALL